MPTSVPGGGTIAINPALYAGRLVIIRARILIGADTNPIATEYPVNIRFNGQYFVNARFRRVGALPPGISFIPDPQGIRFFGVAQATGTYEALFEGPYPDNFTGTSTDGTADTVCDAGSPNPGLQTAQVFNWLARFIVTTRNANSLSFGQMYRYLKNNPNTALRGYRESWQINGS